MMNNIILSRDALFHNRTESMSLEELCRFDTMLRINHVINSALTSDDRERSSGKCLTMQFTTFLDKLRRAFEATVKQEETCGDILIFDDFIRIADYSYAAIQEIVAKPSTHIEKVDTKILANRASGFGSKTMRWMAQRPGRTIEEKISPENKVLTTKTVFSTDTKENREFMYLYKILHEAVMERIKDTKCQNCNLQSKCDYYDWVLKIKKILALNLKIKTSDLSGVKPIKQSYQNNKLMCDKNYKIIWDAVQMLSHVEEKIDKDYNSNLSQRLATLLYWLILGKVISCDGLIIEDYAGALHDRDGSVWFGEPDCISTSYETKVISLDCSGQIERVLSVCLQNHVIVIYSGKDEVYCFNVDEYFSSITTAINAEYVKAVLGSSATVSNQ